MPLPPIQLSEAVISTSFPHKFFSFYQTQTVCYNLIRRYHLPVAHSIHSKILSSILQVPLLTLRIRYFLSNQIIALPTIIQYYVLQYFYHNPKFLVFLYNQNYHSAGILQVCVLPQLLWLSFARIHPPKHKSILSVL